VATKEYWVGPRKVTIVGGRAAVFLGKDFAHLRGKKVMVRVVLLEGRE
jgi:hypothetical protein